MTERTKERAGGAARLGGVQRVPARGAPSSRGERRVPGAASTADARLLARVARGTRSSLGVGVAALLAGAFALRLGLILRGWPALDSDEAIIGLMARHIVGGERPIFYYGQHYLGALEAYIAAGFFAVLGPTTLALHLSELPLTIGFLLAAFWLGRAAYGPAVGLLTLAYLALGPAFGLLRETTVIGGYQETLALGALLLLMVYARLRGPEPRPVGRSEWVRTLAYYAALGVVAGLGIWSDQLILPFVVAALAALVIRRPRELRGAPALAIAVGLVVGAWPFLAYNIQHRGATFAELARQTGPAGHGGLAQALVAWPGQLGAVLSVGLPALFGSPLVCIGRSSAWPSYPPWMVARGGSSVSVCSGLNLLFALGILCCYGLVGWQVGRGAWAWWQARRKLAGRQRSRRRGRRSASQPSPERRTIATRDTARVWLRAMLLFVALGTIALYSLSWTASTYTFTAARYLLPVYVTLPLVFGVLWTAAGPVRRHVRARLTHGATGEVPPSGKRSAVHQPSRSRGQRVSQAAPGGSRSIWQRGLRWLDRAKRPAATAAAVGGIVLLLAFAAYGAGATLWYASESAAFARPLSLSDQRLVADLDRRGITRFVSDYWTCYRLAFESGERLRCAVRDSRNGTLTSNGAVNRYPPYLDLIERTAHPAYLFTAGSTEDATFDTWAAAHGLPHSGYARAVSEGYVIYYWPGGQR